MSDLIHDRLSQIEASKIKGYLPESFCEEVKQLYLLLTRHGRMNARYNKLPKDWLRIGIYAAIMEELIVILRTPNQIGLGDKHLYTICEIIDGIKDFEKKKENKTIRFIFIAKLFAASDFSQITAVLEDCVRYQGLSKRIGIYINKNTNEMNLYAIQGLFGGIELDPRVVRILTGEKDEPCFAVHFTKENIALSIWSQEPISDK